MFFRRRTRVGNHCLDFAAKTPLIELKRGLALAVEVEISIYPHSSFLWLIDD